MTAPQEKPMTLSREADPHKLRWLAEKLEPTSLFLCGEQPKSKEAQEAWIAVLFAIGWLNSEADAAWQPIETAPTNQRIIISESDDPPHDECAMAWLDRADNQFYYAPQGGLVQWKPTHWMPVSAPPSIAKQETVKPPQGSNP